MKIAVIGATGKAGSLIARELSRRGHSVTAVVRPGSEEKLREPYPMIQKDLFDLTTQDLEGFDEVIDAFGSASYGPGGEGVHIDVIRHLIGILAPLPQIRLLVVGGAASLYLDEKGSRRLLDVIPEGPAGALPRNQAAAFELLKQSSLDWTFFSPALRFDPQGEKTGRYILGTDYVICNAEGNSYISYEDYALAMADEAEQGRFRRRRFTAVSDTSFWLRAPEENIYPLSNGLPFTRRGAYFGVYADEAGLRRPDPLFGGGRLTICSRRSIAANNRVLFKIYPVLNGVKLPYATRMRPEQLTLQTAAGAITMTFADDKMLYIRGEKGLGLRFERNAINHEIMKPRGETAWESVLNDVGTLVFNPLKGSIAMDAPWENEYIGTLRMRGEARPDENGEFLLAVEESLYEGILREAYPSYEEALSDMKADWESFLSAFDPLDAALEPKRETAAWMLWSSIIAPSGRLQKPTIFMTGRAIASSWQLAQNAVALRKNPRLAADLLLTYFYEQSPQGQLPDFMDESMIQGQDIKPPLQGWALLEMMERCDPEKIMSREELEMLLGGLVRWGDWFFTCRDEDGDGIPRYEHGDESGFDDSSVFLKTNLVEAPDLCAYLALLYEAAGKLASMLGRSAEAEAYGEKSKELIERMLRVFWNGERFVARAAESREVIASDSLQYYLPLILGKRLPQEVIDKMTADLMKEGEFLSPYGLASEKLESEQFRIAGFGRGFILPPYQILILCGLFEAGKTQEAREIARRYCIALRDSDFNMILDPLRGGATAFGCTWSACAYLILGERLANS